MNSLLSFLSSLLPAPAPAAPEPVIAIRAPCPPPELIAAPACASCVFFDGDAAFDFLPMCRAVEFTAEPVTGATHRGLEIDCHTARATTVCGPYGTRHLPREAVA